MKKIEDALNSKTGGLYFGNRLLLPFHANILKIVIDKDILMDFSPSSRKIYINETDAFTEIYFKDASDLKEVVSKYESIKLIAVEKDKDIFNMNNHLKLVVRLQDDHKVTIEKTDEDTLFIE